VTADADAYRDKRVLAFPATEVTQIALASAEGELQLTRDGSGWWVKGFTRADPDKVEDLLYQLLDVRFDAFSQDGLVPLDAPRNTVTVVLADGARHSFRVGETAEQGTRVDVEGGMSGSVLPTSLTFLQQGPKDIGDSHAIPLDRDDATRIDVDLGGTNWVLSKDGEAWKRGPTLEPAAEAALSAIERVQIHYRDYRKEPAPPIVEPWGRVIVVSGTRERTIEFGSLEGEFRVARDLAGGEPYLVPAADIEAVRVSLQPIAGQVYSTGE
jgi:hypothetical protein